MPKQSEQILEEQLVVQLQSLGYKLVAIPDESSLLTNLKRQIEKHNNISLSTTEFERVLNILNKGSIFEKAKILREKQYIIRDNGKSLYFEFINTEYWCQNEYQVTHQVTVEGAYRNRYDVTLLINGLPLVQIELKRRGLELKEAFNQTIRYQRHSYGANSALFQYVQIFVISNGVNTKYYANNRIQLQNFKQTFYWSDKSNKRLTNVLNGFTSEFLEPCHISKMICRYIVLSDTDKSLMVLRPYQYYAVEAIIDRVINSNKNGYIWHTTGSGKTLTSFKASQLLIANPDIKKVVFVVDRKDLDYKTIQDFESYQSGSVDGTDNTDNLVRQFLGTYKDKKGVPKDTKLIVTTIQKLNSAISKGKFLNKMEALKKEKIIFIFDECHRSQFGETHKRIRGFFENAQMFGFTGTPIFAQNAVRNESGKRTTTELFGECLHKYVITDAIRDENVLKFSVEYVGRYKEKDSENAVDIEVEAIDTKELMEDEKRLEKIADYIIAHYNRKTHTKTFSAMFCVDSIKSLTRYYDILKRKKLEGRHNLNVATIFSYAANDDDPDATGGEIPEELSLAEEPRVLYGLEKVAREKLDEYISDYNKMFGTSFSTKDNQSFYNYYQDISKKVRHKNVDLLIVVNMFLTGFDSKLLNTLFVDKNLKYHGLVQAYSRTNRILNEQKSQGNIVVFRNLKKATDNAISLFSDKEAKDVIIVPPYEEYAKKFNKAFIQLLKIAPTVDSVNDLESEEDELEFIKAFRELARLKNVLTTYADFKWDDLSMQEQQFEDYKSKYLDLYDKVKSNSQKEKVSILNDVDFELELIHRDEINVAYILRLLAELKDAKKSEQERRKKVILDLLNNEVQLRSKKELIQKFINENLPYIKDSDNVTEDFDKFWNEEQSKAFEELVKKEKLSSEKTERLIEAYIFTGREPLRDEAIDLIEGAKPTLLKRKPTAERITNKIIEFVETFINGMM